MSTNFYAYRKIPEKKRHEIADMLRSKEVTDVLSNPSLTIRELENMLNSLCESIPDSLKEYYEEVHLGKRSGGWQFIWQLYPNQYYEPTLASIKEFLSDTETWQIADEYGTHLTPDEFFKEIELVIFRSENAIDSDDYDKIEGIHHSRSISNEFTTREGLRFTTNEFS